MAALSWSGQTDDVLLHVQVAVRSHVTRNIQLAVPILSSPMDTVTEGGMAIAMAQVRRSDLIAARAMNLAALASPVHALFRRHTRRVTFVQLGGMGFIHYNCTLAEQAAAVEVVKSHQPGCAPSVRTVAPDATVADVVSVRHPPSLSVAAMFTCNHDGLIYLFDHTDTLSKHRRVAWLTSPKVARGEVPCWGLSSARS